jgi:hypothetical protein
MATSAAIQKLQGPQNLAGGLKSVGLFPAGLTASLQFSDIDLLAAAIKNWDEDAIQLEPGRFQSRLDLAHTAAMQIHRVALSTAILVRGACVPGSIVFGMQTSGPRRAKWRSRPVAIDDIVTFDGSSEVDLQTTGPSEITAISATNKCSRSMLMHCAAGQS